MRENFLESTRKLFEYYKLLGERTFDQLEEEDLFRRLSSSSNTIAVIVNHLSGNMKSRWTDFLTSDGEKEWRTRDQEFEEVIKSRKELIMKWNEGWQCLFTALDSIDKDNFDTVVYIRNEGHTIVEAINRHVAHYAYHVGQIVYIGKMIRGDAWRSLSIPKGKSTEFNRQKFSIEKRRAHFTEGYKDWHTDE